MNSRRKEKRTMPNRDPNNWQWLLEYIARMPCNVTNHSGARLMVRGEQSHHWRRARPAAAAGKLEAEAVPEAAADC